MKIQFSNPEVEAAIERTVPKLAADGRYYDADGRPVLVYPRPDENPFLEDDGSTSWDEDEN